MNRVVCYWKHQCVTIVLLYGVFTVFTFSSAYAATTALVFRESFESTLSSWTIGGAPECNIVISGDGATFGTPDSPDGGKNLLVNRPANIANPAQGCNISATIPTLVSTYGTVTFWFYDNMSATNNLEMIAVVSNNTGTKTIGLGVRKMLNANEYIYRLSPDSSTSDAHYVSSGVLRSLGWHRFTFILENNTAYAELDAVSLKPKGTLVGMNNFQTIKIAAGAWAGTQPQAARFDGFIVQNNNPVVLGCSFTSPPSLLTTIMSQTSLSSFKHPGNCSGAIRAVESYQDGPNSVLVFEGDNVPVEHDRYEIEFNQNIKPVYGLGFQFGAKQVELRPDHTYTSPSGQVEEILDSNFGDGHANWDYNKGRNGYTYSADRAIMRVPVLVFPKQNILIGYYQPAVDTLRVSWETNKTTVVLKNRADGIGYHYEPYPQFGEQHGKFILIKSDSVKNLYAAYNKLLRTTTKIKEIGSGQLYFKKPHPKAFGLGWETWYEFLRTPTQPGVEAIVGNQTVSGRFSSNNLNLSHVTLGSGYWNYTDETGYNNGKVMPYMEQFQKHPTYWNNISNFVTYLKGKGIYTLLGMRFNVLDSYKDTFLQRLNATQTVKNKYFYSDIAYDGEEFSKDSYFINVLDQEVVNTHIANLQSSPAYGAFKGI
ncbi:hypothetical protein HY468_01575, partial [Candidatus Roizmanbacteria bacterium]|nr:hypothetical protein [Candidatus Roizmanbacteria bacterium]